MKKLIAIVLLATLCKSCDKNYISCEKEQEFKIKETDKNRIRLILSVDTI